MRSASGGVYVLGGMNVSGDNGTSARGNRSRHNATVGAQVRDGLNITSGGLSARGGFLTGEGIVVPDQVSF